MSPSPSRKIRFLLLIPCVIAALATALLVQSAQSTGSRSGERTVTPRGELDAEERATIALFERNRDSVVFITTSGLVRDMWSRNVMEIPQGTGSGFLWDEAGHVVTNFHVIADANVATVRLADGRDYRATLVGTSPMHDIAVLKIDIDVRTPPPVTIGTSADLRVGQKVFAIGNPFGLDWTLTTGIVSALDRSLPAQGRRGAVDNLVQTDAAINPGNSGGPLLDSAGRLIGINTSIFSPSGASAGIGFAVPVDTVMRVVPQLIRHGRYTRPSLGIEMDEQINRRISSLTGTSGVAVLRVARGSPAAQAGLAGLELGPRGEIAAVDIITAVDGRSVDSPARLLARLDNAGVGQRVQLEVWRQGRTREVIATLVAETSSRQNP